jgi:phage terminase large subunit-like protein
MTDNPTPTPPKPKKKRKPRKLDPNRTLLKDMTYEERQAYKKKTCSVCKKTKNKTQFNKDRRSKDGKHHMCKLCNRQNKAWWLYGKPEEEKPMSKNGLPLHVDDLRAMGKDVVALIKQLPPAKAEELKYNWRFWARENQIAPEGDWNNLLILAGRGFGKTRAGSEWVREQVKKGKKRILAVAATNSDIERVMVKGESGLLAVCWKGDKTDRGAHMGYPVWSPTKRTLTWENGAQVLFFSAEEPERLRGPQGDASYIDEICAWTKDRETWDMLQFCLRLGKHPKIFITTTPKPTKLLREIIKNPKTQVVTGSTYDNAANLAKTYLEAVKNQYEGTRLGRQELHAEILDEASGALWTREILSTCEVDKEDIPDLVRVIVSVDPAVTSKEDSDETGIIVAGIDRDGISYILEDHSGTYTPEGWASKAVELYEVLEADCIVAEVNQGGDMVRHTIHTVDPDVPVRMVRASRGKALRAEPVASLYERGKVKHVKGLDKLEDQMVQWEPLGRHSSPDRLDAAVQAVVNLALKNVTLPSLNLGYQSAKGLLSR